MVETSLSRRAPPRGMVLAILLLVAALAATVGTALIFEHGFGYIPCALCLKEREPYYASIAIGIVAAAAAAFGARVLLVRLALAAIGVLMLYGLYLAVYHAGVEWHFWAGPTDCAAAASVDLGGDLLATIDAVHPPACDQAAGRFLGLSFAGWNAVASVVLGAFAFWLAKRYSGSSSLSQ